MEKTENRNLCAECGGYCCKKCGCDYFVSDFENMKLDYLIDVLNTGRVSVVSFLDFKTLPTGKIICNPTLYLRARNINRDEIDLLSFKTTCASLEENGCYYDLEHRPSGGSTLIPRVIDEEFACYNEIDKLEELKKWNAYQKVLERLVKRFTGKSVQAKLKEDVENLFYNILCQNYEGVMKVELLDVQGMLPILMQIYPEELRNAKTRFNSEKPIVLIRDNK